MRPDLVVLSEPDIDGDLGLFCAVELFRIQNFPTERSVEALVEAILLGAAWVALHRLDANAFQPALKRCCDELRAVVRTNELRLAMLHRQPVQNIQNIVGVHLGPHRRAKRFTGVLIKHGEHLVAPPIAELVMHEVNRPDMIGMCRPQPDDRAVLVIEPPSLLMPMGKLQTFFAPQTLNLLVIDLPAFHAQQSRYLSIPVSPVLLGQPDHRQAQSVIIVRPGLISQARPRHTQHSTGPALGSIQLLAGMNDRLTKLLPRQALGFK